MTATTPQRLGNLFLRMAEPLHKLSVALRLFHRVQVSALNVLDNRNFQHLGVRQIANHHRNRMHLRSLRRPPASLARNNLIAACLARKFANN